MNPLITVDAGQVGKEVNALAGFLRLKLQKPVVVKGKILLIDNSENPIKVKDVKTYLKHFIHQRGLSEAYKVTVNRSLIRILKVKVQPKKRVDKSVPPHPADTMPWFFPWKT